MVRLCGSFMKSYMLKVPLVKLREYLAAIKNIAKARIMPLKNIKIKYIISTSR